MAQKYKIFLNEKLLMLEHLAENDKRDNFHLISGTEELLDEIRLLNARQDLQTKSLYTDIPVIQLLNESLKVVKAAGGLVYREPGQLLFIRRFGLWDLPKGKLHKRESTRFGALREVTEETGLSSLNIMEKIGTTYHIYKHKSRPHLKETTWYTMLFTGNETAVPQTEESITDVQWFDYELIPDIMGLTYSSLGDILQNFLEKLYKPNSPV